MEKALLTRIEALNQAISSLDYGRRPDSLYEPIRYIMQLGGKRMRPLLVMLAGEMYGADPNTLLRPALSVEVFHNFSLVHDDLMDEAPLRRGQETVHQRWGATRAILSGDVMLVAAYELLEGLAPEQLVAAFAAFNKAARLVCEGQQLDMDFEQVATVSESAYVEMIGLKTAALLAYSLQLGGIVAGVDPHEQQQLYRLGMAMGTGFQLMDDLLDVYADKDKFGKQVGGDIIANKKTYLLIKALSLAEGNQLNELEHWLVKKDADPAEKVAAVTAVYEELGIRTLAETKMEEYYFEGFRLLDGLAVAESSKTLLRSLFTALTKRQK